MIWFHLKYSNQWNFLHTYIDSFSNLLKTLYIAIICKNTNNYVSYIRPSGSANIWKCTQQVVYIILCALTMEFSVPEILQLNIASQDSDSDDDVLALSGSDSDILETVESRFYRIFGRRYLNVGWIWRRFRFISNLPIASVYNFWRETAERNFGFLLCQIKWFLLKFPVLIVA